MKKLTILTATRDRVDQFGEFLNNIKSLPYFSQVDWVIADNSRTSIQTQKAILCKEILGNADNVQWFNTETFVQARNICVGAVKTDYFTILDDDDRLSPDLYTEFLTWLDVFGEFDFLSFAFERECRLGTREFEPIYAKIVDNKVTALNSFLNYDHDRYHGIYLSNGANIFRTQKWVELNCTYTSRLSDDIYPVTKMYLGSDKVIKTNYLGYIVSSQGTVMSEKTEFQKFDLENWMERQYTSLIKGAKTEEEFSILKKALFNSVCQLIHLEKIPARDLLPIYINLLK